MGEEVKVGETLCNNDSIDIDCKFATAFNLATTTHLLSRIASHLKPPIHPPARVHKTSK